MDGTNIFRKQNFLVECLHYHNYVLRKKITN